MAIGESSASKVALRNNVTSSGQGKPMMFAHGYGCDQTVWNGIVPAFADRRTILFDHVGSGRSDLSSFSRYKYRHLKGYVNDLIEICSALELREVTLVGHSVSASIAALATIERPDLFSSLVMVAPSPCYVSVDDYVGGFRKEDIESLLELLDSNQFGWASSMGPLIMGNPNCPELGQRLANSFCSIDPEAARHFARTTFYANNLEDLPKISVPTLIMQCAEDPIAPSSVGHYMHGVIAHSTLSLMKATGHCPHMSAPAETVSIIKNFLAGVA
ncbi:MAG: alpha/beta fold hydrolase [Janthinobacterium lividum]